MITFTFHENQYLLKEDPFKTNKRYLGFYDLENPDAIKGMIATEELKKLAFFSKIPLCYHEDINKDILTNNVKLLKDIAIIPFMKIIVNNTKFIHVLIDSRRNTDLMGRAGLYLTMKKNDKDEYDVFVGRTGNELLSCLENGILAKDHGGISLLHDEYLLKAIEMFKEYLTEGNYCKRFTIYSETKDPETKILEPWEDTDRLEDCPLCKELGWDGTHSHRWRDGTIYERDENGKRKYTDHKHYGRFVHVVGG